MEFILYAGGRLISSWLENYLLSQRRNSRITTNVSKPVDRDCLRKMTRSCSVSCRPDRRWMKYQEQPATNRSTQQGKVVIDANWRWVHNVGGNL